MTPLSIHTHIHRVVKVASVATLFAALALITLSLASSTVVLAHLPGPRPEPRKAASRSPQSASTIFIPTTKQGVTLNGQCDPTSEWSYSAYYTFTDAAGYVETVYLMQDNDNLYVCLVGYHGSGASRFASVYLDTDNGQEQYATADDLSLSVPLEGGKSSTAMGTSMTGTIHTDPSYTQTVPVLPWAAAPGDSGFDVAEYAIPLTVTGGLCNAPFGLAVYHHWVNGSSGDDYGWPSAQWYDQPQTWQTAQFTTSPCPTRADISQVPPEFQRRAAEHLEDNRGTLAAPGWELATLSSDVRLLYRPDVSGVAYYEFLVVAPSTAGIQAGGTTSAGFIILSTGAHDFPIAHWNFAGESPTQELERKASAAGKRAVKFFKLDTLSYAAEDATGNQAAVSESPLFKITGMNPEWLTNPPTSTEVIWMPDAHLPDDSGAGAISGTVTITGPTSAPITLSEWGSWSELKSGYSDSYAVLAEFLRRDASPDWRMAISLTQVGVILHSGESYTMPFLASLPVVAMEGIGLQHAQTETVTRPGLPDAIRFTAQSVSPGSSYPFSVTVEYPLFSETVHILITERYSIFLPVILQGSGGMTAQRVNAPQAVAQWGPWNVWWAGSHGDQRLYNQIPSGQSPNSSSCSSGCGATAWAMLFGWADHQAALGNPVWAGRWGIYRQDGGYGANADAPQTMDTGVKNMIWEIRNRIGTWCAGSSGPTFPWNMDRAAGYMAYRSTVRVDTHYNVIGWSEERLHHYAANSIVNRRVPAVIGTGWLSHYPLAYGYAWTRRPAEWYEPGDWVYAIRFYVNNGWGGAGNGWVPASTWFAGEIYP